MSEAVGEEDVYLGGGGGAAEEMNESSVSSATKRRNHVKLEEQDDDDKDSEASMSTSRTSSTSKKKGGRGKRHRNRTKQSKVKVISDDIKIYEDNTKTNDDEYIVEEIVGKKMIVTDSGKKLHYHIKWKGWATAHNTWEPLENLTGCLELVDAYEEERTERRNRGLDSDPEADDERTLRETEQMEKSRKELVECGVETRWPTELLPLNLVGVLTIDKHLCYIVRHQVKKSVPSLSSDNTVIVRADGFRHVFPHIVITFYENCILWVNRAEAKEELELKAKRALDNAGISSLSSSLGQQQKQKIAEASGSMMGEEEEVELDEDGLPLPKISIKKNIDLFGLPENHVDSSSSSEDEFVERSIPNPYPAVLSPRNQ